VKEAQDIRDLVPRKNSKEEPGLIAYLEKPQPTTLLVLCHKHKTLDKRSKLNKALAKHAVFFESNKLYDTKLPAWIGTYVKSRGYAIREEACLLLADFIGNDLSRIVHELDKLFLNLEKGGNIDLALIEKYIGISKEYNVFELQKALGTRDTLKSFRIAGHLSANERNSPIVVTLGSLHAYFNKIMTYHYLQDRSERNAAAALGVRPFFVREYATAARHYGPRKVARIFSLLRDCDLKSKGVGNDSATTDDLMKELVYKILH
jgi:DNA polymerase-3 subunit delta